MRLKLTTELLLNANLLSPEQIVQPRIATDDELMLIHKYDYVEAIKHASHGIISEDEAGMDLMMKRMVNLSICTAIVPQLLEAL